MFCLARSAFGHLKHPVPFGTNQTNFGQKNNQRLNVCCKNYTKQGISSHKIHNYTNIIKIIFIL